MTADSTQSSGDDVAAHLGGDHGDVGAEIGVGAGEAFRHRSAGEHLDDARRAKFLEARQQVVACDHGDLRREAERRGPAGEFRRRAARVHPAAVGDDADAARHDLRQDGGGDLHEVGHIAEVGLARPDARQESQGDLGEVVEDEVVDLAPLDELAGAVGTVPPETGGAADADDPVGVHDVTQFG